MFSGQIDTNTMLDNSYEGAIIDIQPIDKIENVGSIQCAICTKIMELLVHEVLNVTDEDAVVRFFEHVCPLLPGDIKDCEKFIEKYGKQIIEFLSQDVAPSEICSLLQLCGSRNLEGIKVSENEIENASSVEQSLEESNAECTLCKIIMQEIDDSLKNHEESIENTVRNICQRLPDALKEDCTNFVKDYGDTVIQLLIQVLEPSDICPYLKLCKSTALEYQDDPPKDDCYVCKRIVWNMAKILANPKAQHDMKHVLEKTCRAIPFKSRKQCQEIISEKGKDIYVLLIHKTEKRTICTRLGYCKREPEV